MWAFYSILACSEANKEPNGLNGMPILEDVLSSNYDDELVPVEDIDTHPLIQSHFSWYTHLLSPSGEPVMILAQSELSRRQIIRLRELLQFGLRSHDLSGAQNMDLVFDAVADNRASLLFFNDEDTRSAAIEDGVFDLDWRAFSTLKSENILPGSDSWLTNAPPDLAHAICIDLIFQSGWGRVDPDLESALLELSNTAIAEGIWLPNSDVLESWSDNAQAAAYLSQLVGIDFGNWADSSTPWEGQWTVNSREDIAQVHPEAAAQLRLIMPSFFDLPIQLEPELSESITLNYTSDSLWSAKSQYYIDVSLSGSEDIDLVGNAQDNILAGNAGSNRLVGGDGVDTVRFQGPSSEYDIQSTANGFILFDEDLDRDGADEIIEFEWVEFSDGLIAIDELLNR